MAVVDRPPLPETCAAPPAPALWVGYGHAVYLGPSLRLEPHSTAVYCLAVGVDAPLTLRVDGSADVVLRSVLVPPRAVHQIVATGERMLFCYFDPGSARAGGCLERMAAAQGGFGSGHRAEAELVGLCGAPALDALGILDAASGPVLGPVDERIDGVIRSIRAQPGSPVSAAEFARDTHLSTPYFLRLFAAETGTSFRRYRLWARMLHVATAVSKGSDLTRAAVDAGFATPSHFSDAFRRMFGLTATALLTGGVEIVVDGP
ncbi:AraC family transcriptional regulator [Rhodococcus maanshanensis]|uniref:AraC-type DNA-binding protein n=1 Tax=Rhodococcus maanshanensis TaxID=183556 RepID=A0A1H7IB95_9NOCA|nr:AraC family transcriptional regulator [Rhodococcus maanshanensis]SEK59614.1 AraC-type DNA-binding protein [Rhodococcus maanshanensis]